jgi:hypothetical protein
MPARRRAPQVCDSKAQSLWRTIRQDLGEPRNPQQRVRLLLSERKGSGNSIRWKGERPC